jgi:hypothetical protein
VHHPDPDIEIGDATFHHRHTGAKHTSGLSCQTSSVGRVKWCQDGICSIQVRPFHLVPDWVVTMVGADRAAAMPPFTHQTEKLFVWEQGW